MPFYEAYLKMWLILKAIHVNELRDRVPVDRANRGIVQDQI